MSHRHRAHRRGSRRHRIRTRVRRVGVLFLAFSLTFGAGWAFWSTTSVPGGNGAAAVATVGRGETPVISATGDTITVDWAASGLSTGEAVDGYRVARYDATTHVVQTALSACVGTIAATSCTESSVPVGRWVYAVTPVYSINWLGAESPDSIAVDVDPLPANSGPDLGDAGGFSVLGYTAVTSTGTSSVSGDLGVSPSSNITGFPPSLVGGTTHAGDIPAAQAQSALVQAYDDARTRTSTSSFGGDQNGGTFHAGVHSTAAAFALTGTLTLDGDGDPNAVFVFQVDAALNTAVASHVVLINGARASHVFWQVNGAAGLGANSTFSGTIMAAGAITLGADTELIGRALSRDAVTLASSTIRFTEALPPTVTIAGGAAQVTKDPTPDIAGTTDAAAGRPVTVTVAGQSQSSTVQADGTWSVTTASLAPGTHTIVARVRDAAGNTGFATQALTVEINPSTVALGAASTFSVLAATGVDNTDATTMTGDLGVSPADAVSGFPPGIVGGMMHAGDSAAGLARDALDTAYADAAGRAAHTSFDGVLGGRTFHIGVHHTTAAMALTGTVTLDAEGDPDAIFIFQTDGALNTAANSQVVLANGAQASHVFWQVSGAAGTGASSTFAGTILASGAITLGAGCQLTGRALSLGTVTLAGNVITTS